MAVPVEKALQLDSLIALLGSSINLFKFYLPPEDDPWCLKHVLGCYNQWEMVCGNKNELIRFDKGRSRYVCVILI